MAKKKKKRSDEGKRALGEEWRSQMTEECESVPELVHRRVLKKFRIDLADKKVATAEQVYELLNPLQGFDPIKREHLEELIDRAVPKVFGLK